MITLPIFFFGVITLSFGVEQMSDGTPVVPHLNDDVTTSLQWGHTVWNWKCRSGVKVNLSA
jgi:hypothetical protein